MLQRPPSSRRCFGLECMSAVRSRTSCTEEAVTSINFMVCAHDEMQLRLCSLAGHLGTQLFFLSSDACGVSVAQALHLGTQQLLGGAVRCN